jgi:nitrogen fixation NifU-like protein
MDHGMDTIYREYILDLYRNPKNKKKIDDATCTAHQNNPTCGDEITIYIKMENGKIDDVGFEGIGCAISQASASLFTEHIKNKSLDEVIQMTDTDVLELLGIDVGINREKCALLIYRAFTQAIEHR